MAKNFKIKRHDLQPYYKFSIPTASDLTGATFTCTMVNKKTKEKVIDTQAAGCFVTDTAARECEYRWQGSDTGTLGEHLIEFEITPQMGGKFTVPVDKEYIVEVVPDLNEQ